MRNQLPRWQATLSLSRGRQLSIEAIAGKVGVRMHVEK